MLDTQKTPQVSTPINRFYLRYLREHVLQLTLEELAENINTSVQTVRSWETGRTQPNQKQRPVLERCLGIAPGHLALNIKEILYEDFNAAYFGDEAARQRLNWAYENRELTKFIDGLCPESIER